MAVQGAVNAVLAKKIGQFHAAFLVHVTGAALLAIILLLGLAQGDLKNLRASPWWSFLGGPLSVLIVWGVISSVSRIGVGAATTAILALQILTALLLDLLGVTGQKVSLNFSRVLGAVVFIIGAYLLLKKPS